MRQYKKVKSYGARGISTKHLTNGEAHLRILAPERHSYQSFYDLMFNLTALGNKPQISRTDSNFVATELSGRSQNSTHNR